jgi:hypothetical protein
VPERGCGVVSGIQNRRSTLSSHRFALVAQRWVFGAWVRRIWVFLALHFNTDTKEKKETSHAGVGGGEPCDGGREKMGLGRKWGEMKMGIGVSRGWVLCLDFEFEFFFFFLKKKKKKKKRAETTDVAHATSPS